MDNSSRRSLLSRVAAKGVISPYEAINLQYLNRRHVSEQELDMTKRENPYLAAGDIKEIIQPYELKQIVEYTSYEDAMLYDSYKWSAENIFNFEARVGEIGYKGIALMDELRAMKSEGDIIWSIQGKKPSEEDLWELSGYSQVHGKVMTFKELFESLFATFRFLIIGIDNALTLNFYLKTMVPLEDLKCLDYLEMWSKDGLSSEEQQWEEEINFAKLYHMHTEEIIRTNHKHFVEFLNRKLTSLGITPHPNFEEESLAYVKKSLSQIVDTVGDK